MPHGAKEPEGILSGQVTAGQPGPELEQEPASHLQVHPGPDGRTARPGRLRDRARDRRAEKLARDSAIADLLTTSVELVLAINAIRAAYQHRTNARSRLLTAAALLQDLPNLDAWRDLTDWDVIRTSLRTATGPARDQETDSRTIALDYAGMVLPQISRFFAAVTAVTMGPGKEIADAARQLGTTGGALLEAAGARKRNHARAQDRFDRELGKLRAAADRRLVVVVVVVARLSRPAPQLSTFL